MSEKKLTVPVQCPHCQKHHEVRFSVASSSLRSPSTHTYDWSLVDWSQGNSEIAKQLGAAYAHVSSKRAQLAPQTQDLTRQRKTKWSEIDWSKTTAEIAAEVGTSCVVVSSYRRTHAPETVRVSPWRGIDWSLTDVEIARLRGVSRQAVSFKRKKIKNQ